MRDERVGYTKKHLAHRSDVAPQQNSYISESKKWSGIDDTTWGTRPVRRNVVLRARIELNSTFRKKAKGIVPRTGPPVPEVVDANHINAMSKEGWRSGSLRSVLGSVAPTDEKNPQTTSSLTDTKPHCPVMPSVCLIVRHDSS
jgi:hypothetical protein